MLERRGNRIRSPQAQAFMATDHRRYHMPMSSGLSTAAPSCSLVAPCWCLERGPQPGKKLAPRPPIAMPRGAQRAPRARDSTSTALQMAITVPMISNRARVVRASAPAVPQTPYVDAARAAVVGHGRIIFRHMLPNYALYPIMLTAYGGQAILLEASLSFLGLGVAEPTAAWGLMSEGAALGFAERAPWTAIFPGLAISLGVFAFNLFGDFLRDARTPVVGVVRGGENTPRPQLSPPRRNWRGNCLAQP